MVTIIIPCRNEESFIGKCLDSIIANDYPKDKLEVLVIDGISEDKTREIINKYTQQYSFISLLDNLKEIVPTALNIGIQNAKGDIIIRMDAHTTYKKDYVTKCVKYLQKYDVDNVGGICVTLPGAETVIAKAIALVYAHPFGVGNAHFRIGEKEPKIVDTVPFGCYRRQVFERIGFFDERLVRTQDLEFNLRLKRSGGKILLVPDIVTYYYARSDFKSFCKYFFINSFWVTYPIKFLHYMPVSWRHLIPLVFVSSLGISIILSIFFPIFLCLFLLIVGSYFFTNLFFSSIVAFHEKNLRYFFVILILFPTLHLSYGLGSLFGLVKSVIESRFGTNSKVA